MAAKQEECLESFGRAMAVSQAAAEQLTSREQAEAAWTAMYRGTVDDLEDEIRSDRGLPPLPRGGGVAEDRPE